MNHRFDVPSLSFPVPIIWVKDLQKMDKWNYLIKKFGPTATAMGPLTVGTQVQTKNIDFANAITVLEKEGNLSGMYMPPPVVACLTDEQKRAVNTEDARQAKATKIRRANQNLSKILDEVRSALRTRTSFERGVSHHPALR